MPNDQATPGAPRPDDARYNPKAVAAYNREAEPTLDAVERRAFERYVFELVRGWAEAQDNLRRKHFGRDDHIAIRDVTLEDDYPETVIVLQTYERNRDRAGELRHPLWKDPTFFDSETGRRLLSPEKMAGDILMLARGG